MKERFLDRRTKDEAGTIYIAIATSLSLNSEVELNNFPPCNCIKNYEESY